MTQFDLSTSSTDTLDLRTHPDLNSLQHTAFRQRDAFIGALIRQGLGRVKKALVGLLVPPVTPHGA
ncbi:hypothetical protein [Saccharospirillum salsuginis]|uniref:Uncharacterized protein n=1 Tax=Saccharospirillum salsuginis TaxID=418750 RepID=A0A918KPT4_9GAMM|nr:hypothetical protein [Saccharospirillum salsuginis]GGX68666.1 hypothetical protein GCM10007392_40350 [Saccharospirillum salsuginis]